NVSAATARATLILDGKGVRNGHRRQECGGGNQCTGCCAEYHGGVGGASRDCKSQQHNMAARRQDAILPLIRASSPARPTSFLPCRCPRHRPPASPAATRRLPSPNGS